MSVEFLTNLPLAPKLLPTNLSDSCCRFFFCFFLSFAILGSASGEDIYTVCLLIFWHSAVAEVSTLRTKSLGTISVLSVVTKAAAEEDHTNKQAQKKKRKKHLVCLGEKKKMLSRNRAALRVTTGQSDMWLMTEELIGCWNLIGLLWRGAWCRCVRRVGSNTCSLTCCCLCGSSPTRRQHFAPGSLLLAAPSTLSVKRWKRFQIQEAARRSIPRRSALSGSCSDSLIAPSLHHRRHLLPSPTSSFLCFAPLMNSAAHFKEAAVIKAQRDSQDHSNLCTLERLNKHVSVICCPCIGGFSFGCFLSIYLFFFTYFSSGILTSNRRRQLERERISCLCREYANVRRWSLWSRTARRPDRTIIDGGGSRREIFFT